MRKIAKGVAALALVCSSAASAEGGYWGATVGLMDIDQRNVDSPLNVGLRGGYTLPSGWGFEAEYTNSLISGEADVFDGDVDVDVQTLAGYGTYRSYGDLYFKGRLGVLYEDVSVGRFSEDDTGISLGAGVGFNYSPNTNVELEYTVIEEDIGFWSGTVTLNF
ncbi:outer membrane beta-barrel protein [Microbulbifer marinus]|uniref:Outer membrane protein beta-barrel domain-containing protein n=1 Tax=Microbulbifer marinus TaxID=658218 RepID=A0A1H4BCG2_9GAMM|nr:outer membrane beta-barrel protein [Microbulbifer marinus]SEA45905.1 Outer membrane protein beta-barrel domain-containing protein [Microbulbifer marinus]